MAITDSVELKSGENILREVRRYPLVDFGKYSLAFVLMIAPFFFLFPLMKLHGWGIAGGAIIFLSGLIIFTRTLFLWFHNVFVVTSCRIIDFDQRGFFERVVSQSSLDQIQDVSFHIHGAAQTFFRYGDVNIKTGWGSVELCVPAIFRLRCKVM
ncbi:MAG: PH domain-containing protein [Candidatus Magasanikbacteria bacterium]|nr:PH domain-containing protein [Candidatus Magasanikbacteria bacterium]